MKNIPWDELAALPTLQAVEDQHIRRVMQLCGGNVRQASAVLDVPRATLYRKVVALGIETAGARALRDRAELAAGIEQLRRRQVSP